MKYILISAIPDHIYYLADYIDSDNDTSFGINLTFYSYNKIELTKLYKLLYNIEEGKFYRQQHGFKVLAFKNEQLILWLQRFGLEGDGTLYKISLKIEDIGSFNNCFTIAKRVVRRIGQKFSFEPIINNLDKDKRKMTLKLQKYFLEHKY